MITAETATPWGGVATTTTTSARNAKVHVDRNGNVKVTDDDAAAKEKRKKWALSRKLIVRTNTFPIAFIFSPIYIMIEFLTNIMNI